MAGSRRRNRDRHPAATTAPPEFLREPPTPVKAGKQGELSFSPPMFVCKLLYIIRLERFPAYTNRGAGDAVQGRNWSIRVRTGWKGFAILLLRN
jgi:hypothetical protein